MTSEEKAKRIYWAVTAPFVVTTMLAGVMLLAGVASNVEGMTHLGYLSFDTEGLSEGT